MYISITCTPSTRWEGAYDYRRSDEDAHEPQLFDSWSDAYDGGAGIDSDGNCWAHAPGYDWVAVTAEQADMVWAAIDGSEGDCGFIAAFRLAEQFGIDIPTNEEFDNMGQDADEWPRNVAWEVLKMFSGEHAAAYKRGGNA